jgi:hypothetical protein
MSEYDDAFRDVYRLRSQSPAVEIKTTKTDWDEEEDTNLCPVCQELPMPEFKSCSCWWCHDCGTTNPAGLLSCGGCDCTTRPDDAESVTRRLIVMVQRMKRVPAWNRGEVATLQEAIDLLRTHALDPDHESMLE